MVERLQKLFSEYGKIAIAIHIVIYGIAILGFASAITAGLDVQGAAGTAGALGAGYVAAKAAMPVRIAIVVALTPLVAKVIRRLKGSSNDEPKPPPSMGSGSHRTAAKITGASSQTENATEPQGPNVNQFSPVLMQNSDESPTRP